MEPGRPCRPGLHKPSQVALTAPDVLPKLPAPHGAVHAAEPRPALAPYKPALQLLQKPQPLRLY